MIFTCCECEHHYSPDVDGDADERMCYKCLDKDETNKGENNE